MKICAFHLVFTSTLTAFVCERGIMGKRCELFAQHRVHSALVFHLRAMSLHWDLMHSMEIVVQPPNMDTIYFAICCLAHDITCVHVSHG